MKTLQLLILLVPTACATSGNAWMRQGYGSGTNSDGWDEKELPITPEARRPNPAHDTAMASRTLGNPPTNHHASERPEMSTEPRVAISESGKSRKTGHRGASIPPEGRVLGKFRNTYYDFPIEADFSGERVPIHGAQCKSLAHVPRGFFEALCVQGSGMLTSGSAVSFNRRDCDCAEICPRTQQKICFDTLDSSQFPWGRGATGGPITPLFTVAVDSNVIPLGTAIYIPEYDGLPRDSSRKALHDGCFVAQDRGLRVVGQHVDVFTGERSMTELWNSLVPSNVGVTVVLESLKCARH